MSETIHPDFALLAKSWDLSLEADGYAPTTRTAYGRALVGLARYLREYHDDVAPADVARDHIRAWIVHTRNATSSGTARSHFAGLRHFFRWAVDEREIVRDPTEGIRTPAPNEARTELIAVEDIRKLLAGCDNSFIGIRDEAIIQLFADGGLRIGELAALTVESVDRSARVVFVEGKGSNRSGPRRRAVPMGVKCARAVDRYLRERRHHPYAHLERLWLGGRNRSTLSPDGIAAMLTRRAAKIGLTLHPHQLRHTWADAFRGAGGSEGDLMVLGGWRSRQMLDRYGRANAEGRARDAYRRLSFGDRL